MVEIIERRLSDDGDIPNNAALALIVYRRAVDPEAGDAESALDDLFHANGWGGGWRGGGIYDFHHYHAEAHEVVGIAAGTARVQFGGPSGPVLEVSAGDAVLIPAGVGHCRVDTVPGLSAVGAYPAGQRPDLKRQGEADPADVRRAIARVPLPARDPVLGLDGGSAVLWRDLPAAE